MPTLPELTNGRIMRTMTYTFDGNDQLSDLNSSVTDLAEENRTLRKRLSDLKEKQ